MIWLHMIEQNSEKKTIYRFFLNLQETFYLNVGMEMCT